MNPSLGPRADWWRGAVIYQIYPRSFLDTNGDGVGDLEGIRRKLDYVANLGVDAVWISPFFRSPMKDFGYDVSDYRSVDPLFGTLEDFDRVLREAHRLGLKVMIDQVLSHTSDQHAWFQESRASRQGPKADWYVWADPKADGTPPTNWLSLFGGSAWQWDTGRGQYYLHNFLVSQPDLNFHNPEVVEALLRETRFWLDRGVDGFRLDALNFCFHDPLLRDNPPRKEMESLRLSRADNPYSFQEHVYDKNRPEMIGLLQKLRALADEYPGTALMAEIGDDHGLTMMADYTCGPDRLHLAYAFDLLTPEGRAPFLRETVERLEACIEDGWPCWSIGNHDVTRVVSRWGKERAEAHAEQLAPLYLALLVSLRGSACLYQGDELGLTEVEIAFEDLRDPYGLAMWPQFKGRDGCRTPMPWEQEAASAGFSAAKPWLPIPTDHLSLSVDRQRANPESSLNRCAQFLKWRRTHPALVRGEIRFLEAPEGVLLFARTLGSEKIMAGTKAVESSGAEESILVAINLTAESRRVAWPREKGELSPLQGHGFRGEWLLGPESGSIDLPPFQAFFGRSVL